MKIVAAQIRALVMVPFSWGTRLGCADISWSTPTVSPGAEIFSPRSDVAEVPSLVLLNRHNELERRSEERRVVTTQIMEDLQKRSSLMIARIALNALLIVASEHIIRTALLRTQSSSLHWYHVPYSYMLRICGQNTLPQCSGRLLLRQHKTGSINSM